MTLAACIFTKSHIIHAADRRVVSAFPSGRMKIRCELRNKTIIVGLNDAVAVVSFDGVAEMKTPPGVKTITTDDALAQYIKSQPYPGILNNLFEYIFQFLKYQDFHEFEKYGTGIHVLAYQWSKKRIQAKPIFYHLSVRDGKATMRSFNSKQIYEMQKDRGITQLLVSQRWATQAQIDKYQKQLHDIGPDKEIHLAQVLAKFLGEVSSNQIAVGDQIMATILPRVPKGNITGASVFFTKTDPNDSQPKVLKCYRPWVMEYNGGVIEPGFVNIPPNTNLASKFMGGSLMSRAFSY